MSGKIIAAIAAAILLATTGLASAESVKPNAARHNSEQRYYNMAPDPAPSTDPSPYYPFPVTGQSAA